MPSLKYNPKTGKQEFISNNPVINENTGQRLYSSADPAATSPAKDEYISNAYTVKSGDTLNSIASGLGYKNYKDANLTGYRSGNPDLIYPGEKLNYGGASTVGTTGGGAGTGSGTYTTPSGAVVDANGNVISTPEVNPVDAAYERYLQSLSPSQELKDATLRLNEMDTQAGLDYEAALEKGDTLGFARGEAGLTARQNAILRAGQAGHVTALEALEKRKGEISKAQYEYEKSKIEAEAEKNPDFKLSEGQTQWRYNPETGDYEQIASGPTDELDDAYRRAQIRNIDDQIRERGEDDDDDSQYTIPKSARNIILGMGFSAGDVDNLQNDIRQYGIAAVLKHYENSPVYPQLRELLNKQGLIYE